MSYTDHANGAFLTRNGNYNVGSKILDQEITLTRYINTATDNLTASAFYKLWSVPAGFQVNQIYAGCVTAETTDGTDTFDIVDNDSATTVLLNDVDLSAAGTVTATTARKYYAAAGFICIRPNQDLTTAKFYITVKGVVQNTSM